MREICLYKKPNGRYMELRPERLQLCGYDRCAAALMPEFAYWTSIRMEQMRQAREPGPPWIDVSKEQLRDGLLGVFSEWSIERGIWVLSDKVGVLDVQAPGGIGLPNRYLFHWEKLNQMLAAVLPEATPSPARHPKRRKSWEGQQVTVGDNTGVPRVKTPTAAGENTDGPSVITPAYAGENTDERGGIKSLGITDLQTSTPDPAAAVFSPSPSRQTSERTGPGHYDMERNWIPDAPKTKTFRGGRQAPPKSGAGSDTPRQGGGGKADRQNLGRMRREQTAGASGDDGLVVSGTHPPGNGNSGAAVASGRDFIGEWNRAIPECPADIRFLPKDPSAFQDPTFDECFPQVCAVAAKLIQNGANLPLGKLLSRYPKSERYWWQLLLAHELDWMAPKIAPSKGYLVQSNGNGSSITENAITALRAKIQAKKACKEQRMKEKKEKAEHENRTAGTDEIPGGAHA